MIHYVDPVSTVFPRRFQPFGMVQYKSLNTLNSFRAERTQEGIIIKSMISNQISFICLVSSKNIYKCLRRVVCERVIWFAFLSGAMCAEGVGCVGYLGTSWHRGSQLVALLVALTAISSPLSLAFKIILRYLVVETFRIYH